MSVIRRRGRGPVPAPKVAIPSPDAFAAERGLSHVRLLDPEDAPFFGIPGNEAPVVYAARDSEGLPCCLLYDLLGAWRKLPCPSPVYLGPGPSLDARRPGSDWTEIDLERRAPAPWFDVRSSSPEHPDARGRVALLGAYHWRRHAPGALKPAPTAAEKRAERERLKGAEREAKAARKAEREARKTGRAKP